MVINITAADSAAAHESSTTGGSGGDAEIDQVIDRTHPAAQILAEFGADPAIIAEALAARPDLTPQQVRDTWEHFQRRIAAGRVNPDAGAFFSAIRSGQLHAAPRRHELDPAAYADDPAFVLGGQAQPDEGAQRNAVYRDAHWRAVDLLGPGAPFRDMRIVVEALVAGDSDEQALARLAARQQRRGGP